MCGIVGFFGSNVRVKYKTLMDSAIANRHRGDKDGWGIIDLDNEKHYRKLIHLSEIASGEVEKSRGWRTRKVGILSMREYDEGYYKQVSKKVLNNVSKLLDEESDAVILHHRAKSRGEVKLENTHPIPLKESRVVHNGTITRELDAIRHWFKLIEGSEFKGETDTEILGEAADICRDHLNLSLRDTYDLLCDVFGNFGVLIRSPKNGEVEIYKTSSRTLWFYTKGKSLFFISEPIPNIKAFSQLYEMDSGAIILSKFFDVKQELVEEGIITNYTGRWKESLKDWTRLQDMDPGIVTTTCDDCKTKKEYVARILPKYGNVSMRTDFCFECWLRQEKVVLKE